MDTPENIEVLKGKIKELAKAVEKQRKKKSSLRAFIFGEDHSASGSGISVSFLSKLINSSVDAVIAADREGNLIVFNEVASVIFGYTAEEALFNLNIRDLYPGDGAFEVMARLRSEKNGGAGKLAGVLVHVNDKAGDSFPARINASIVYEDGREIATIGYLRDLRLNRHPECRLSELASSIKNTDQGVSLHDFFSGVTNQLQLYDRKFCVGAVENELVTIDHIKLALSKQFEIIEKTKVHVPIGRIMIQLGMLTEEQRDAILNLQRVDIQQTLCGAVPGMETGNPAPEGKADLDQIVELKITENELTASIQVENDRRAGVELEEIIAFVEKSGIQYGMVDHSVIEAYLRADDTPAGPLVIAQGKVPIPEKPAEAQYFFTFDPLGVGAAREDGSIDWKNRGKLPQAKSGDVLAEITPGADGVPGMNIFGIEIQPPCMKPSLPKCGKGVVMSEDGTQYLARLDGMVSMSDDNKITIVEMFAVGGDVGLETGHIEFDGHVEVAGSIHKGYRVSCKSLRAEDIQEAEITVAGDVVIAGGVYDATVKCRGGLQASHINKSNIEAGGNLVVEKEIMASVIEIGGKCMIPEGTITYSKISARNGIEANHIGTKGAKPSTLSIGVDEGGDRQIKFTRKKVALQKRDLASLPAVIEKLQLQLEKLERESLTHLKRQSKHALRIENKQKEIDAMDGEQQAAEALKVQKTIDTLKTKKGSIDDLVKADKARSERITERIVRKEEDLANGEQKLKDLMDELDGLEASKAQTPDDVAVEAKGVVYSGTTVSGPNATLTMSEDLSRLRLLETKTVEADGNMLWQMQVKKLG